MEKSEDIRGMRELEMEAQDEETDIPFGFNIGPSHRGLTLFDANHPYQTERAFSSTERTPEYLLM